ncbi:MAG TPA: peptidoglycan DD-metalloendopeptidase family protein [Candidatus Limnocylindria bacterium]|nr:peptidoglycan DD-metalloendopeptidase family protein [Candidatus Limnocylindria bacterium]
MRRRPRLAAIIGALVVATSLVGSTPTGPVRGGDPLTEAQNQQRQLQEQLASQQAALDSLRALSATLDQRLAAAQAELASVSTEYERVNGLLGAVELQIAEVKARLEIIRTRIESLDRMLATLASEIARQTRRLTTRESLLEDHYRDAYERSQTSLLEVLLAADSFEVVATQVGYLLTISEQDAALADEIRDLRGELKSNQTMLAQGLVEQQEARDLQEAEEARLAQRQAELAALKQRLGELVIAAEQKRQQQAAALNAALVAQGDVERQIQATKEAAAAANALVARLLAESRQRVSQRGFRWPMDQFVITQEWGPTNFLLEDGYTYRGVYYPHFHGGIDMANGCGSRIRAAATGVVVASGQPLWPWDSGYGVVIDHGGGVLSWYWHLRAQVVVYPGQGVAVGDVIGYEGNTGMSTGCHLHFAINDNGVWENPRYFLP